MAFSTIVSIYLLEYVAYLNKNFFKAEFTKYDIRTKYQILNDMINDGIDATVVVPHPEKMKTQDGIEFYPLSGISNKTTINCNESGDFSIYLSDRYGFNNPDSEWDKRGGVILIGDSFTHGACVPQGKDIASQIRIISNTPVLNLGYGGNGPLQELAILTEYSIPADIKSIVWLYFEGNDLFDLVNEIDANYIPYINGNFKRGMAKYQKEIDDNLLLFIDKKRQEREEHLKKIEKNTISQILVLRHIRNLLKTDYRVDLVKDDNVVEINPLFEEILQRAKVLSSELGAELYFVYLPEFRRYYQEKGDSFRKMKQVKEIVFKLNIPLIDLHKDLFSEEKKPLDLFEGGIDNHYSSNTYQRIAKEIANVIHKK